MRGRASWTESMLRRQLRALPSMQYEVGVFDGQMTRRVLRPREIVRSVGWLKARNRAGSHVYLRPAGTKFVLVDEVNLGGVERMREQDVVPAAVVEASPGILQVWVRFPVAMQPDLATSVGRLLAERYGGDPGASGFRHLGRAAGFTNRTRAYRAEDGRFPWVEMVEAAGAVTPNADELVEEASRRLMAEEDERAARAQAVNGTLRQARRRGLRSPEAFFARELAELCRRFGPSVDPSRGESSVARKMAVVGFRPDEVAAALSASESVRRRKADSLEDYVTRTVGWAFGENRRRPR